MKGRKPDFIVSSVVDVAEPTMSAEVVDLDKHGEASWEIRRPALLHHYELKWIY